MQSWDSQIYKVLLPPTEKFQDSESSDSDDDWDSGHDTNTLSPDYGLSQSRKTRGRVKPSKQQGQSPRLSQKRGSLVSESEEEENRRYGLDDPELPHLSEEAKSGEGTEDSYCRGDICRPSPACLGAGLVAGILVIFGILVVFMVLEHKHEEKQKLEYLLRAAGGVAIVFCLLLCCCNSCVCCTRNLSHRPVSAPSYIRNIVAGVADSRRSSGERRPSVPIIQVHSAKPSAGLPGLLSDDLEKGNLGSVGTEKGLGLDNVSVTTLCIVEDDGAKLSGDVGSTVAPKQKSGSEDALGGATEGTEPEKRDSIFTIDSYEMDPNAKILIPSESDNKKDETSKAKEMQSLKMLGTLSLFIEAINSNSKQPKEIGTKDEKAEKGDSESDPTSDPNIEPTSDPSNEPTNDSSSDPITDPINDPTSDPSIATEGDEDNTEKVDSDPKKETEDGGDNAAAEGGGSDPTSEPETEPVTNPSENEENRVKSGKKKRKSIPGGQPAKKIGGRKQSIGKGVKKNGGRENKKEEEGSGPDKIKKTQGLVKKRKIPLPAYLLAAKKRIGPAK